MVTLARDELGIETIERDIDRTELYVADECFMTGTAAHVTPVIEVDRGPVSARLQELYFDILQGKNPKYSQWCTPCYTKVKA